jgi:hypothetical protein
MANIRNFEQLMEEVKQIFQKHGSGLIDFQQNKIYISFNFKELCKDIVKLINEEVEKRSPKRLLK